MAATRPSPHDAAWLEGHDDGRLGGFAVAHEDGGLGHGQVNAGALHRPQGFDRTGELAFEAALVVHLLGELTDTEGLAVHQFETDIAAARQALFGQLQAQAVHGIPRYQQGGAALAEAIGNAAAVQLTDDATAIGLGEVAVEDTILGLARPHQQCHHDRDHGSAADQNGDQRVAAKLLLDALQHRGGRSAARGVLTLLRRGAVAHAPPCRRAPSAAGKMLLEAGIDCIRSPRSGCPMGRNCDERYYASRHPLQRREKPLFYLPIGSLVTFRKLIALLYIRQEPVSAASGRKQTSLPWR